MTTVRSTRAVLVALAIDVAACTGSGGSTPPPPSTPGSVQLASASYTVAENAGTLLLTVTRTGGSDGAVTVRLATADGSATAPADYAAVATTVAFAAGDAAPKTVIVTIVDDTAIEPTETFTVSLTGPTGGAALGNPSTATVSIQDDDAPVTGPRLDDTGVTGCGDATANGLACGIGGFPRQDAEVGRDVTANDGRDGRAGFSFTKLDAAGAPLADQVASYATTPWSCLLDRVTGLTWEVHLSDGSPRDRSARFTWYDSSGAAGAKTNGVANGGTCPGGAACDTEKYVALVNGAALCGRTDWRLPRRDELLSLVDYGAATAPLVDAASLPDGAADAYWSSSVDISGRPWSVDFAAGGSKAEQPGLRRAVRLVRGGI